MNCVREQATGTISEGDPPRRVERAGPISGSLSRTSTTESTRSSSTTGTRTTARWTRCCDSNTTWSSKVTEP